jgi:hypothetical protein
MLQHRRLLLSLIVLPVLRSRLEPAQLGPVVRETARRFGVAANVVLLPVLLITGLALLWHRGVTFSWSSPRHSCPDTQR